MGGTEGGKIGGRNKRKNVSEDRWERKVGCVKVQLHY